MLHLKNESSIRLQTCFPCFLLNPRIHYQSTRIISRLYSKYTVTPFIKYNSINAHAFRFPGSIKKKLMSNNKIK